MRYAKIRKLDISNGTGMRVSVFVQGCNRHCKGCFNPETWSFNGGKEWTIEELTRIIDYLNNPHIEGLSILGGEPFEQDSMIDELIIKTKNTTKKNIWLWTGYKFSEIPENKKYLLPYIDVIVDGAFIEDERDLRLRFRGSHNQRIIDVQKTLKNNNNVIIWSDLPNNNVEN